MKLVVVKWKDASVQLGDVFEGDMCKDCHMVTTGIFIEQDKNYISIASEVYLQDTKFRYVTHIPNDMIIKKKIINIKEL